MEKEGNKAGGASRLNLGKPKLGRVSPLVIQAMAEILDASREKYPDRDNGTMNWQHGLDYDGAMDSVLRHINKWLAGEDFDGESGKHHLDHAITGLHFIVHFIKLDMCDMLDNRPFKKYNDYIDGHC